MFNKNSVVAKTWSQAIKKGDKTIEEVPNLSNLIAVVANLVEEVEEDV